jgi:membrane-associated protein
MHLTDTILAFGYIGVFLTIFAESGFFLGFFLPGDSLLFTLGIAASLGHFNIGVLLILCIIAAIAGDSFGYWMGSFFGEKLFTKAHKRILRPEYLEKTQYFFQKYGRKTIIISRFVPIVRTFAPIFAGIGKMPYKTFLAFNVIGGVVWAGGVLSLSYYLGKKVPQVQEYLGVIIIVIIGVSLLPPLFEIYKTHRRSK